MKGITCPACKSTITELKDGACPVCNNSFSAYEAQAIAEDLNKKARGPKIVVSVVAILTIALFAWIVIVIPKAAKEGLSEAKQLAGQSSVVYNSEWDASVYQVKDWLKQNLKDPKSLEYIEWSKVINTADNYVVRVKYRAKNSFGGYVVSNQLFTLSKTGTVLNVQDYQ